MGNVPTIIRLTPRVSGSLVLTGTMVSGSPAAADIVTGGLTVIGTLTGDQNHGDLGTDCQITTDFLAAFVCSTSQTNGWNNEVLPLLTYAMLSVSAQEWELTLPPVPNYVIETSEVMTFTQPASSLLASSSPIVASPTITVERDSDEPTYSAAVHYLIDSEDFTSFDSILGGSTPLGDKYSCEYFSYLDDVGGQHTNWGWDADGVTAGMISMVTGRGGAGGAFRCVYGGSASGLNEIKVGTFNKLGSVGSLDAGAGLPEIEGSYTHIYLTSWFRTSVDADPSDGSSSAIKGFCIYLAGSNQRLQLSPKRLKYDNGNSDATRLWPTTRWNIGAGWPPNDWTGGNQWKTADGNPPLWIDAGGTSYNDGNWHRVTREVYTASDPSGHVGERFWLNGVLMFDNIDNFPTGNDPEGDPWANQLYMTAAKYTPSITHYIVWGNYATWATQIASGQFTIDFDDWLVWTDK